MFERFSEAARRVVVIAQQDARERADTHIDPGHLLLGVAQVPDAAGAALLRERGLDAATIAGELITLRGAAALPDRDALADLGIDLDEIRRRVDDTFGPGALESTRAAGGGARRGWGGHIPFDRDAKKTLELGLREAVRAGARSYGTEHLLLGLLHPGTDPASRVLAAHGVTLAEVRAAADGLDDGGAAASG